MKYISCWSLRTIYRPILHLSKINSVGFNGNTEHFYQKYFHAHWYDSHVPQAHYTTPIQFSCDDHSQYGQNDDRNIHERFHPHLKPEIANIGHCHWHLGWSVHTVNRSFIIHIKILVHMRWPLLQYFHSTFIDHDSKLL